MRSTPQLSILKGPMQDIPPSSLHKLFEYNLHKNSSKSALIYNEKEINRTLTYQEVADRSNQFAKVFLRETLQHSLQSNQDGDYVVGVCMKHSDDLVMVLLATWKAGAAYLPIDPELPPDRIAHIINDTCPLLVICDNDIDSSLFKPINVIQVDELYQKANQMDTSGIPEEQILKGKEDLAIVSYTSGSTGVPKGVRLPHAVVLNRLKWQWLRFPFTSEESVCVFKTSLTFLDSVSEIWSPLLNGLTLVIVPKPTTKDPEKLVALLDHHKVSRIVLVPSLLSNILMYLKMSQKIRKTTATDHSDHKLPYLRNWVCSGESLPKNLVEEFFDCFKEGTHTLHNFYGCTEVMADVLYFCCKNKQELEKFEKIPLGTPISNTVVYILDQDYQPVRNGEIGEIFVAGLNIASGYVNGRDPDRFIENPLAVEEKFSRLYKTGDLGSLRGGYIYFEGRADSQVKIRGHRIDLIDVEKTIMSMDIIKRAIVLCHHVNQTNQTLLAFVQLNNTSVRISGLQIESALKKKLQDFMIPHVLIIDEIPLLINGKVDRQTLLKTYETKPKNVEPFDLSTVPGDLKQIAKEIFLIVSDVLGTSARGTLTMESNFYEMGGNSLNSILTITMLREKGYHIEINDFIYAKNLGEIIYKIQSTTTKPRCRLPHFDIKAFPICKDDKKECIEMIVESFMVKGDLEQLIKEKIIHEESERLIEEIWDDALKKGYSFVVKDVKKNTIIGVMINFDANDEPESKINTYNDATFDIVSDLEEPFRRNEMPAGLNKVMHACLTATKSTLSPEENIACIYFMEEETIKMAKKYNFVGILTSNTSPLTQQLAAEFNYQCLVDFPVNKYVHKDGKRPFELAPDSQKLMVHYKEL